MNSMEIRVGPKEQVVQGIPIGRLNNLETRVKTLEVGGVSKEIFYNSDGTVSEITSSLGDKTFTYSNGMLMSITGTGVYISKSFIYDSSNRLTNVNV
jgi:hypothetical protein